MERTITLHIPYPPSANNLWRAVGGRVISSERYVKWKHEAAGILGPQIRNMWVFGAYELEIKLTARRPRGDSDNRIKAVNDILQTLGVVVNDNGCRKASVEKTDTGVHDCLVTICGNVAFENQWDFAKAKIEKRLSRR